MTKLFTINDFISYNAPCFNCNSKISIKFQSTLFSNSSYIETISISPTISKNSIELILKITYDHSLILKISPKFNKFETNNIPLLTNFLQSHKLHIISKCPNCQTIIESQFLDFNIPKSFILPFGISKEFLSINDSTKSSLYLYNYFLENKSILKTSSLSLNLNIIPLYSFPNKLSLLNKLKSYLIFI